MRKRLLIAFLTLSALVLPIVLGVPHVQASAPPPLDTSGTLVGFDAPAFNAKQYAYINEANGHIIELYRTLSSQWTWTDLTQVSGAPPAETSGGSTTLTGFYSSQFQAKHYGYFASNGDLIDMQASISHRNWTWKVARSGRGEGHHLIGFDSSQFSTMRYIWADIVGEPLQVFSTDGGQNWSFDDMGRDDLNSLCFSDPLPVGFDSTGSQSIQFANPLNNPQELVGSDPLAGDILESYTQSGQGSGTHWSCNDLTRILGAPQTGGGMVGFSMPAPNNKQYAYLDQQGQLEEMFLQGQTWSVTKPTSLSAFVGAPPADLRRNGELAGFYSSFFNRKQYAYVDQNGNIQELMTVNGFWTRVTPSLTQQLLGAMPSFEVSNLLGFDSPKFHSIQWAYVDGSGHIQQLFVGDGSGIGDGSRIWLQLDLTATTPQA